jgi:tetratricopeptide (TPR) repeat protein
MLHVVGEAPITDSDAKALQLEILNTLEKVRMLDPDVSKQRLAAGAAALAQLAAGIDAQKKRSYSDAAAAYTKAIEGFPDYARAYALRATADEELKQWKACREDLAKAMQLDPRPEVANRAAGVFLKEAQDRAKDKQWVEASKSWKEVLRADPKNTNYRRDVIKFYQDWWTDLKRGPAGKAKELVEEIEKNRWGDKEFNKPMADMVAEAAEMILRDNKKNWDRARSLAQHALTYDRNNAKAQDVIKQADAARKAAETPKHK